MGVTNSDKALRDNPPDFYGVSPRFGELQQRWEAAEGYADVNKLDDPKLREPQADTQAGGDISDAFMVARRACHSKARIVAIDVADCCAYRVGRVGYFPKRLLRLIGGLVGRTLVWWRFFWWCGLVEHLSPLMIKVPCVAWFSSRGFPCAISIENVPDTPSEKTLQNRTLVLNMCVLAIRKGPTVKPWSHFKGLTQR